MEKQRAGARGPAILACGALIQVLTGIPAAWGVFQEPVRQEWGFGEEQAALVLSCLVGAYGLGCVAGGWLQDRRGPRTAALLGTALLTAGLFAAGFVPKGGLWAFYGGFALPVGLGTAFLYPAVMSCAQKWYARRKGLATGVIGGAVGLSGAFLSWFVGAVDGRWGIRAAFWGLGGLCLFVCGGAGLLLQDPAGETAPARQQGGGPVLSPRQLPGEKNYWLCLAAVSLASPSVLLFSPHLQQLGQERGLGPSAAVWAVTLGSVGSAAGRLLLPWLSDRWGRKRTDLCLFGLLAVLGTGFAFARGRLWLALYALLTFCYSGQAALLPALCTDLFGLEHAGGNYGLVALGMTAGALGFPLLAAGLGLKAGRHALAVGAALAGLAALRALELPDSGRKAGCPYKDDKMRSDRPDW